MFIGEENPTTTTTTVNHEDNLADNATAVPSEACAKINSAKNGVKINLNNGNSNNKNNNVRMKINENNKRILNRNGLLNLNYIYLIGGKGCK